MKDFIDDQDDQPKIPQNQIIKYAKAPPKNNMLRKNDSIVSLCSNLMKLTLTDPLQKVYIYSIDILPELAKDNYTLQKKIYRTIEDKLAPHFKKMSFAGYNLFCSTKNPVDEISIDVNVDKIDYKIIFKKVGLLNFSEILTNEGIDQKKKNFVEKLIKDILLSSKDRIRFGSNRMVLNTDNNSIIHNNDGSNIYKGFFTSAQITESGLYLLVLNMNKYVSGKTMYDKIRQIKSDNRKDSQEEIRLKIEEYIEEHKTVLATYGSIRAYRIEYIDFEKNPDNTSFNLKTKDGMMKTISIYNYYMQQYKIRIKDREQPLLVAEKKFKDKKLLKNEEENKKNEDILYLVPELVFITGIENEAGSKNRRQDIISKTKTNPNIKMSEINKIHNLINSDEQKEIRRNGEIISTKSSKKLADEWGINLGENLSLEGRILRQPSLRFDNQTVNPRNGTYRAESAYDGATITRDNFMYIYNKNDRSDIRYLIGSLLKKAEQKNMKVKVSSHDVYSYGLNNTRDWDSIKSELNKIRFGDKMKMIIVFYDNYLERYYNKFKDYFTNVVKSYSQLISTRNVTNPKRANSIMLNIVDQINAKMGGINFCIDTKKIIGDKICLIMGLESKRVGKDLIDYVMTFSYNQKMSRTQTIPRTCKDNKEEISKVLNEYIDEALNGIHNLGHAPHPPDDIIIYRPGGNHIQNLKISQLEVPIFLENLNKKKGQYNSFKRTKLTYICCNLKGDLKFFEEKSNNNKDKFYSNPPSGLCIDEKIVESGKFEFYLQPQFVNQGTATPCHYEVLYQDRDEEHPENNLSIEEIENLSFQLSFYYWTWNGAVRVPGVLKLSTTAIDFYSRCLNHKLNLEGNKFSTPAFI